MKFSVIVPAYNSELYIGELLESIINQTFLDYEVIIVDDGSMDKTNNIVKKYIKEHINFHLIESVNKGVSSARNIGIENASGEYIVFADADDYMDENALSTFNDIINGSELGIAEFKMVPSNQTHSYKLNKEKMNRDEIIHQIAIGNIDGYLWNKVFLRKILRENNILFDTKLTIWEDFLFVINYVRNISYTTISKKIVYNYRIVDGSATGKFNVKKQNACLEAANEILFTAIEINNTELIQYARKLRYETCIHYCLMLMKQFKYNCDFKEKVILLREYKKGVKRKTKNKMFEVLINIYYFFRRKFDE